MKNIKYLVIALFTVMISCEDILDKPPLDAITDSAVWKDEKLADSYLAHVYSTVEFRTLGSRLSNASMGLFAGLGGESTQFAGWQAPNRAIRTPMNATTLYRPMAYWKYDLIRKINTFIEEVEASPDLSDTYKTQRIAEARWIRAYIYFEKVKRWGGVPLITKTQPIDADRESLFVSRNTEQEIYDFIDTEMEAVYSVLPESYDSNNNGRCTKWAAKALQSRAMMYAASIARFGSVELNGLVGIPNGLENDYWTKSYNASKMLIEQSGHTLYKKYADKVKNYSQLFIDEIENNPEVIFTERYDFASGMGHSQSALAVHADFAFTWNSNFRPYLDMVEKFEFADGTSGAIDRSLYATKEWSMDELFDNRDPRFKASILYNGAEMGWKSNNYNSNIAYFHEFSLVNGNKVKSGVLPDGVPAKAKNRAYEPRPKPLRQGFLLRKFLDENPGKQLDGSESDTDFHIFRLGEIYLNMAEAAFYLGNTGEALDLLNVIRDRSGMPNKTVINEDVLRNERAVELCFEDHRFWDLRRWRIAEAELNGKRMKGLKFVYNYDTSKFQIEVKNADPRDREFLPEYYYFPFTLNRLADNPNLKENPGYN